MRCKVCSTESSTRALIDLRLVRGVILSAVVICACAPPPVVVPPPAITVVVAPPPPSRCEDVERVLVEDAITALAARDAGVEEPDEEKE